MRAICLRSVNRLAIVMSFAIACGPPGDEATGGDTGTTGTETGSSGDDGAPEPAGPDAAPDPSDFGPFPVGVQTWSLEDPSRGDPGPRPIVTEVWYPATDESIGDTPVTYRIEDVMRPDALALLQEPVDVELTTDAVRDAPVRLDDGPYPVVMFSHGSGGVRMQSTYLTVYLASHGYVVVSPDHDGNTISDLVVSGGADQSAMLQSFQDRPIDLDFLVEHLAALPPEDPLASAIDLDRMGVAGHSFGALTSIRWMGLGADVDAVVAQAPPGMDLTWLSISDPLADFATPLMLHVGGLDNTTPPEDADSIWVEASPPRSMLTLTRGDHFTFSDMCRLDPEAIVGAAEIGLDENLLDDCGPERISIDIAAPVLRHYAIGYFNLHLRDSAPTADLLTEAAGQAIAGADELTFELDP